MCIVLAISEIKIGEKESGTGIVVSARGIYYLYGMASVKPREPVDFLLVTNLTNHIPWIIRTLATHVSVERR